VVAVAGRIDWKYALGLELDDPGFGNSALSEFRGRLVEHECSRLCFDKVLDRCRELGLVKPGGKQRTDSTHVLAAVRDLMHAELAGEAVRALAEALAAVAPDFLAEAVDLTAWAKRYRPSACDWNWPRAKRSASRGCHTASPSCAGSRTVCVHPCPARAIQH
jgi:hypothetical protein